MVFEDIDKAATAVTVAFDYMEWTWQDEDGKIFRPRREDIKSMYEALRDSLLDDEGRHDFIKADGLMVDLTDAGTMIFRMEPQREMAYRMAFALNVGAPFEYPGDPTEESDKGTDKFLDW